MGFVTAAASPAIAASGPAAPFVALALAIAPLFIPLIKNIGKGCGESCVLTSQAANDIEKLLKKNVEIFEKSGKTRVEQEAALAVFDETWGRLVDYCSQPEFQQTKAGKNCIADRREGACKWKDASGQCWNWFIGYRDPIANASLNQSANAANNAPGAGRDSVAGAINQADGKAPSAIAGLDNNTLLLIGVGVVVLILVSN